MLLLLRSFMEHNNLSRQPFRTAQVRVCRVHVTNVTPCCVCLQIMVQPVIVPSGKTFEYAAVKEWVQRHGTDPNTGKPVSLRDLYSNLVVRELIEQWVQGHGTLGSIAGEVSGQNEDVGQHMHRARETSRHGDAACSTLKANADENYHELQQTSTSSSSTSGGNTPAAVHSEAQPLGTCSDPSMLRHRQMQTRQQGVDSSSAGICSHDDSPPALADYRQQGQLGSCSASSLKHKGSRPGSSQQQ